MLFAFVVGASALYGGDVAADSWCAQPASPFLRPALQQVQAVCSVQVPDGPAATAAAKACFAAWFAVKNLVSGQPSLYELAAGWEGMGATAAPYDTRLLRAAAADAKLLLAQIR